MMPGGVPRVWRVDRSIGQIDVAEAGWFIDIGAPESLSTLRTAWAGLLAQHDVTDMDVSVIRGPNRALTCAIAQWLEHQVLYDGSLPLGIRYMSRHATNWECWAILPGRQVVQRSVSGLHLIDPDLLQIAEVFRLRLHGS